VPAASAEGAADGAAAGSTKRDVTQSTLLQPASSSTSVPAAARRKTRGARPKAQVGRRQGELVGQVGLSMGVGPRKAGDTRRTAPSP
jgi:hypothetical protein